MKRVHYSIFVLIAMVFMAACTSEDLHTDRARKEYLLPLRQGGMEGSPFWNVHSTRFLYAPAFDFKTVEGAERYKFTLSRKDACDVVFYASSPRESLSKVWNDISPDSVRLVVEGVDRSGNVLGVAGERKFFRAFPFVAKDEAPARGYREAALKACLYVHNMPAVQNWKNSTVPDMTYPFNAYVCKIIGATIRTECLLAREMPQLREDALKIALNAAEYLVMMSQSDGSILEGWPPTYGVAPSDKTSHPAKVAKLNAGKMMVLEASVPGEAYLDLYDATGDNLWKERAHTIARTFGTIQAEDGSWPTRIDRATGKQIGQTKAFPGHILRFLRRCIEDYDMTEWQAVIDKAEAYINAVAMKSFDLTGQFEDSLYDVLEPYSNLTNFTASPYADYLLTKACPTEQDVANAMDLIRLSEDQFVHWDFPADRYGFKDRMTPCVNEQYYYEVPVDASTADVCDGYLALYEYNKDPLALAKAKALLNVLTRVQNPVTGQIPTLLQYNGGYDQRLEDFWLNCSWWSAKALLRLDEIVNADTQTAGNPVFPGWYSDPEAVVWEDEYWIFPTTSIPFREQTYIDAFSSKDLVHWKKHEHIVDTTEVKWIWQAMWSPAVIKKDGFYYLFICGNDMYVDGDGGIGYVRADRPGGPYKDVLGRPLLDKIINGAQPIDQYVFEDTDGTYYMYYGGWGHCNVCMLNDDFTGFVQFEDGETFKEITPDGYYEGPFMFKKDGRYYFMWSEGTWTRDDYRVAYAIADNPLGPFERIGVILQQDPEIGTGAGHHSVVHEPKSGKWYIFYHRHPLGSTDGNHREVCIDEMHFDENGYILPIKMTFEGVVSNPLTSPEK